MRRKSLQTHHWASLDITMVILWPTSTYILSNHVQHRRFDDSLKSHFSVTLLSLSLFVLFTCINKVAGGCVFACINLCVWLLRKLCMDLDKIWNVGEGIFVNDFSLDSGSWSAVKPNGLIYIKLGVCLCVFVGGGGQINTNECILL